MRFRLRYSVPYKNFKFFAFAEPYNDTRNNYALTKVRYTGGFDYSLTDNHTIQFQYRHHDFHAVDLHNYQHAFITRYTYSF